MVTVRIDRALQKAGIVNRCSRVVRLCFVILVLTAGCASLPGRPDSTSADHSTLKGPVEAVEMQPFVTDGKLNHTEWEFVSLFEGDVEVSVVYFEGNAQYPNKAFYVVGFNGAGRFYIPACQAIFGPVSVEGSRLVFGETGTPDTMCDEQGKIVVRVLGTLLYRSDPTWAIENDLLVLEGNGIRATLRQLPNGSPGLQF
jgi:heat shock protein HslJ